MKKIKHKRKLTGTVTSTKMDKTVVIKIERSIRHPKYQKIYTVSKNYLAHAETGSYKQGDKVIIEACRPFSKNKKWQVIKKV